MDRLSSIMIVKALDGLAARSIATAENLANANSIGYRPVRVSFEEALASAAAAGTGAVRAVQPSFARDALQPGQGGVRIDLELATASATSARYSALVEVLNRQLQIDALAVSGGR